MTRQNIYVLIVDDSEDDRFLLRRGIARRGGRLQVIGEAQNGIEAAAYLGGQDLYADRSRHPFPDLVILDLKMPLMNGMEFLEWLQTQTFSAPKTVLFSDAFTAQIREQALQLGARDGFAKTPHAAELTRILTALEGMFDEPEPARTPAVSRAACSVLIADDSEDDRFLLREVIASDAPALKVISEVRDGREVIEYLTGQGRYGDRQQFPLPDLLLMDWRMPGMDGLELLEWLRDNPTPQLKIAVLADSSGTNREAEILAGGADWFFSKKQGPSELVNTVRKLQANCLQGQAGLKTADQQPAA